MQIAGIRVCYRATGQGGALHCQRCGGDRPYLRRAGRRWIHVLRLPLIPLAPVGEHLRCMICRTCYRVELLAVPTTAAMQTALLTGTISASLAMLRAGDSASPAARRRAIELIRSSGEAGFDAGSLSAALVQSEPPATRSAPGSGQETDVTLSGLTLQLEMYAREWFLANVVRIGLADGPLSTGERQVVRVIAKSLGMTQAQAQDVIWLTEEAAQAG